MAYAESLGLDTSSSSSAVQRIHQVTTKKMSALAKASPAMTACDEAIERVAQKPHDQLLAARCASFLEMRCDGQGGVFWGVRQYNCSLTVSDISEVSFASAPLS